MSSNFVRFHKILEILFQTDVERVPAFYLGKQKNFIPKKIFFWAAVSKYASRDRKDGICCPNFQ